MGLAWINRIRNNNTSNTMQAAWIGLGSLVSLLFGIVSSAVLSRYLTKVDYGTYKQVLYIYNTLLIVFSLGLPKAYSYFLARASIEEGFSIIRKINGIFWIIGAAFSLLLYFGSYAFSTILNNQDLEDCLKLFALTPLFLLPTMGVESVMATYKKAHVNAIYLLSTRTFSLLCVVIPVVFFHATAYVAIIGFVVSSLLTCILGHYLERIPFKGQKRIESSLRFKEIFAFSIPLLFASIWGLVTNSANQFFVSRYWGTEVFAEFSNGFIELPFAGMVISAVATVLLPVFSKMAHEGTEVKDFLGLWKSVFIKSAKIIYPLAIFFCVFAPEVMVFLYGNEYSNSSVYFQIMLVVNLARVVPFAPLVIALGKVKSYARIQMLTAIFIVVLEYISVHLFSSPYAIAIAYVLCFLFCIIALLRIISKSFSVSLISLIPNKTLFLILFLSIIVCVGVKMVFVFLPNIPLVFMLCIAFALFAVLYLGACKICRLSYNDIISSLIGSRVAR